MAYELAQPEPNLERHDGRIDALMTEYARYVRHEHAICRCPVVRSGVEIVRSMLEWKAAQHDDRSLEHWTRTDIRDYLLRYLPATAVSYPMLADSPTCAKDLVYFLADRGTLRGDDVDELVKTTDDVVYLTTRPADAIPSPAKSSPSEHRRARRRAARAARRRNRRA